MSKRGQSFCIRCLMERLLVVRTGWYLHETSSLLSIRVKVNCRETKNNAPPPFSRLPLIWILKVSKDCFSNVVVLFIMFQSRAYIERRHGKTGTDRAYYLSQLAQEYKTTDSQGKFGLFLLSSPITSLHENWHTEAKQQVLANLANFAYDPINYNTLWDLQVVDMFLGG